jgi:hypothetical protein
MPTRMLIQDLKDEYLVCRSIGHAWDDNPTAVVNSDLFRASLACLALRCSRCTTERFDYIGNDMKVFQRYYRYPVDYTTVIGDPSEAMRPQLRAELVSRSLLVRRRPQPRKRSQQLVSV